MIMLCMLTIVYIILLDFPSFILCPFLCSLSQNYYYTNSSGYQFMYYNIIIILQYCITYYIHGSFYVFICVHFPYYYQSV